MLDYMFKDILQTQVTIEDFYLLGSNFVVSLQTMEDKRSIMKRKYMLKKVRGAKNAMIFINEYLLPAVQEKRRREKEITASMDQQGKGDRVSYTKAGLTIEGRPYRKKVQPPTPKELVNMDIDELEHILKINLKKNAELSQDNSIFSAYVGTARSHKGIRDVYRKMKLIQPGARHIVCAYYIDHPDEYYSQDFQDDGEPGAGRVLLKILTQNNLKNHVIFVARKYGGIRMGPERFQCYAESAKAALISAGIQINIAEKSRQSTNKDIPEHENANRTNSAVKDSAPKTASALQNSPQQQLSGNNSAKSPPPFTSPHQQVSRGRGNSFNYQSRRPYGRGRARNFGASVRGAKQSTQYEASSNMSYESLGRAGQLFPNHDYRRRGRGAASSSAGNNAFGFKYIQENNNSDLD